MYNHYEQERQVSIKIEKYHRDPIRDRNLRSARSDRPNEIARRVMSLRATIIALLATADARIRREPVSVLEPAAEPADTAGTT